jgi:hypothetical protein
VNTGKVATSVKIESESKDITPEFAILCFMGPPPVLFKSFATSKTALGHAIHAALYHVISNKRML